MVSKFHFLVKMSSLYLEKWLSYWTKYERGHLLLLLVCLQLIIQSKLELKLKVRSLDNSGLGHKTVLVTEKTFAIETIYATGAKKYVLYKS